MTPEQHQAAINVLSHYSIHDSLQIKLIMMIKQLEHTKIWTMQVVQELTREQSIQNMQPELHAKFNTE